MFFFIFGWGSPRVHDHGEVETRRCPHCHNERPWRLIETGSYLTLFFVPIWRTSHSWELTCPICSFSYGLTEDDVARYFPGS